MHKDKIILFVTEDMSISSRLKELVKESGYHTIVTPVFNDASEADLILCDYLLLPEKFFSEDFFNQTDLIVLFDSFEEEAIVQVLNRGVSAYLLRPITSRVLDAVIRAFLRYKTTFEHTIPETLVFGDRTFHVLNLTIDSPEGTIHLTPSEAGILKHLLMHRGHLCLRKHLLKEVKGNVQTIVPRNVDVHIASLRKKLGPYKSKIMTVRGVGYLFSTEEAL
ncbi:transcriptional regulatory domain family protein [Chlamydia ibidis]|uniref:Transcriptional regulatory domain family protein n=2 Tax=Chlamydia ibidis TaxID=1405396 RepID=S7J3H6_9CHLA|nr:response regulator transcription factor [Chlamydia ibidis]EPP34582.1 transcriptional regulatory domain family protein [Chlamydia ibidis]EQM63205.1 transcriptional regulator [Chlamydia ibidis 10-1398/6]